MKLSKRVQACELSPMRKFHPFAVEAQAKGRKIYHLNIGQPDIATPEVYFDAVRNFASPVLAYAESPGVPSYLAAVQAYYDRLGAHYDESEILATTGGSEALSILMQCILDPGSEVLIPEPFYPNYATFICAAFVIWYGLFSVPSPFVNSVVSGSSADETVGRPSSPVFHFWRLAIPELWTFSFSSKVNASDFISERGLVVLPTGGQGFFKFSELKSSHSIALYVHSISRAPVPTLLPATPLICPLVSV